MINIKELPEHFSVKNISINKKRIKDNEWNISYNSITNLYCLVINTYEVCIKINFTLAECEIKRIIINTNDYNLIELSISNSFPCVAVSSTEYIQVNNNINDNLFIDYVKTLINKFKRKIR